MWPCVNDITGRSAAVNDLILLVHGDAVDETLQFAHFHVDSVHPSLLRLDAPDLQGPIARSDKTPTVKMHPRDIVRVAACIVAG